MEVLRAEWARFGGINSEFGGRKRVFRSSFMSDAADSTGVFVFVWYLDCVSAALATVSENL